MCDCSHPRAKPETKESNEKQKISIPVAGENPWKTCLDPLLEEDRLKCEAWRDEVQNLLLFAGLFSAVVTAFVIQSYQDLQADDAGIEQSLVNLISILSQRSNSSAIFERGSMSLPKTQTYPSASTIRVNVCWFISLILSLMTVLIGIVSLQWIREYQKYPNNILPKRAFAARNLRSEGLDRWYVPEIFAGLPLLLQSALVIFLVGLTDFLLHLNVIVAWPAIAMTGATLLFLFVTTVLPPIQALWLINMRKSNSIPAQCPYKSPQSWAFFRVASSWCLRFILNLIGHTAFHVLVWPVSSIALILNLLGMKDYTWKSISFLHVTLKLKRLGSLRDWSEFDGFWLDERHRLYTKSSEPSKYFEKLIGNFDCDAARGIAHVVDGRAGEESIAVSIYHCFRELPSVVIRDDIFKLMSQRFPLWMTSNQATRKLAPICPPDCPIVREENEMFLLSRLPQTSLANHVFQRRHLELFFRVLRHIFDSSSIRIKAYADVQDGGYTSRRPFNPGPGKLAIPRCLISLQQIEGLPEPLSADIQKQLITIFQKLVSEVVDLSNRNHALQLAFPSEQILGDFMQLMKIITLSIAKMTRVPSSQTRENALSCLLEGLHTLNQEARSQSPENPKLATYVGVLYVSRFCPDDWTSISGTESDLSRAFGSLVLSLDDVGLTRFNFTVHRDFYRKQCEDMVNEIRVRPIQTSFVDSDATNSQINIKVVPEHFEDQVSLSVEKILGDDPSLSSSGKGHPSSERDRLEKSDVPKYPARVKVRCPTRG